MFSLIFNIITNAVYFENSKSLAASIMNGLERSNCLSTQRRKVIAIVWHFSGTETKPNLSDDTLSSIYKRKQPSVKSLDTYSLPKGSAWVSAKLDVSMRELNTTVNQIKKHNHFTRFN